MVKQVECRSCTPRMNGTPLGTSTSLNIHHASKDIHLQQVHSESRVILDFPPSHSWCKATAKFFQKFTMPEMSRATSPTVLQFPLRKSFICTSPSFTVLDESDGNVRRRLMFEFMPSAQSCSHDECVIRTSYYAHILLYNVYIYIYTYISLYANIYIYIIYTCI